MMGYAMAIRFLNVLVLLVLLSTSAQANVRLPAIFGDHMVLQQNQKSNVWGWADSGEQVRVSLHDEAGKELAAVETTADQDGRWSLQLDPPPAGGPYQMKVAGHNNLLLHDILVGEVWLCSGQSNMQWSVSRSDNPEEEIAAAQYPQIRLFTVTRAVAEQPQEDLVGQWTPTTPESVKEFSAVAYYFGRKLHKELDVPIGLINSSWGGTRAEAWTSLPTLEQDDMFRPILERAATFEPNNPHQPAVLFNGMIHPLVPFSVRGVIWYQGESNVSRAAQYEKLFPAMIADWREQWDQGDFPFLFVQLAPFRYGNHDPQMAAELRDAQRTTLRVPNTGMAVTLDIGDVADIHPTNKQEVGRRLALWALAKTYGKEVPYSGPLYESMEVVGDKVRINFRHAEGLTARSGELTHFEIAGQDGQFVPAKAVIEGETVVVTSDQVKDPVAVRYGWRDDAEPNLFNQADLPASSFRTDSFPRVTEEAR